jgi:hypothetical protein
VSRAALVVAALFTACFILSLRRPIVTSDGKSNLYAHQAYAFLHRRLNVDPSQYDSARFQGRGFVPFPPFPAVVLMPVVAVFGVQRTNTALLATLLTALNIFMAYQLFKRLGLAPDDRVWLLLGLVFGTGYWYIVQCSGAVWFWAHLVAVTCLLAAIAEAWGRGRGQWVGAALAGAFLSRQMTILAAVALAWRLWRHPEFATRAQRWRNLALFAVTIAAGGAAYLTFNAVRFGSPFDTGYSHIPFGGVFEARRVRHGLFSAAYVPFNFLYLLFQGFHVDFQSATRLSNPVPDGFGTSLLAASPFVVLALFAARARGQVAALWVSVVAIAANQLFYVNNGAAQVNTQRFTLDFLPLLLVLIAMGMRREVERDRAGLWRGCIVYAALLNALMLVVLPALAPALRALDY